MKENPSHPKKNLQKASKEKLVDPISLENASIDIKLNRLKKEIDLLTYEDSLRKLDELLEELQKDQMKVEELQEYYLRGNLYLNHCEKLLNDIQQDVVNLDPDTLTQDK